MVERFLNWCMVSHRHDLARDDNGAWVKYTDYESLERENAELRCIIEESYPKASFLFARADMAEHKQAREAAEGGKAVEGGDQ